MRTRTEIEKSNTRSTVVGAPDHTEVYTDDLMATPDGLRLEVLLDIRDLLSPEKVNAPMPDFQCTCGGSAAMCMKHALNPTMGNYPPTAKAGD